MDEHPELFEIIQDQYVIQWHGSRISSRRGPLASGFATETGLVSVSTETWVLSLGLGKNFGETETYAYSVLIIIVIVNKSMNYPSMSTTIVYH